MAIPSSFEDRLKIVFEKTQTKVGPEVARQLGALIEPQALAILAGTIAAWVISHAFGVGEAIDLILGVVGVVSIGRVLERHQFSSQQEVPVCLPATWRWL